MSIRDQTRNDKQQEEIDRLSSIIAIYKYNRSWGLLLESQQLDITEFASNYSEEFSS